MAWWWGGSATSFPAPDIGTDVWLVGLGPATTLPLLLFALAARKLAERQAVNDAANTADLLAEAVVQPALTDSIADGDTLYQYKLPLTSYAREDIAAGRVRWLEMTPA